MTSPQDATDAAAGSTDQPGRPPSTARRLGRAWLLTTLTNGTLGVIVFIVTPWANNLLGPNGRGRLTAVQLLPQILADLSSIGLGFAIVHFGAARRSSLGTLLRWSWKPALAGTAVMFGIGQAIVQLTVSGHASDERTMRLYLLICPVTAVLVLCSEALRATGDFGRWNLFVLGRGLSWPIAMIAGVTGSVSIMRIALVHLSLLGCLAVAILAVIARRLRDDRDEPLTNPGTYVRYGALSAVSTVPRTANAKLDQVVMTYRVGDADLGLYSAAVGWSAITLPIMRGLMGITMPHVSEASSDEQRLARARQVVTVSGVVAIAMTIVGGAFTALLWHVRYSSSFDPAFRAALILIPAGMLLELNGILGNVLRSLQRPGLVAVLEVVVLGASTGALLAVLGSSTVTGPALVSLLTYVAATWLYAVLIARTLGVATRSLVDVGFALEQGRRAGRTVWRRIRR